MKRNGFLDRVNRDRLIAKTPEELAEWLDAILLKAPVEVETNE